MKIVATFVYASSQGQRTHSARTKINVLDTMGLVMGDYRIETEGKSIRIKLEENAGKMFI